MPFVSFAQNFEDVMLWRALKGVEQGFYIDIGAFSATIDSVTRAFYERGWHGINVEPSQLYYNELAQHRPLDINLPQAVSDVTGQAEMYFVPNSGLSSLNETVAREHEPHGWPVIASEVELTTLAAIWTSHVPAGQDVHFLKVDVEGAEEEVLRGNDWGRNRPWIVIVEATKPFSQVDSYDSWEPLLILADYEFAYADGLNRFYVAAERKHLAEAFRYPPSFFDDLIRWRECEAEARAAAAEEEREQFAAQAAEQVTALKACHAEVLARTRDSIDVLRDEFAIDRASHEREVITLQAAHAKEVMTLSGKLARAESFINYVTQRKLLERMFFRPDGRPVKPLRRLLFHTSGKPRRLFRHLVLHKDSTPRKAFARWMQNQTCRATAATQQAARLTAERNAHRGRAEVQLSIAIPVYNFAKFVPDTLNSILSQTFGSTVEIVVTDGASTDNTEEVMAEICGRHKNVVYNRLERKGGIDLDMAKAVEATHGEYVWLFSGDDIMHPNGLEFVLDNIKSGHDLYLSKHLECNIRMELITEWPVLAPDIPEVFELSDSVRRLEYFERAVNSEAFFSFCGGLVVRRTVWNRGTLNEGFVGSCFAHSARFFALMKEGLSVSYTGKALLSRRGGNDSFSENGRVARIKMQVDGFLDIADTFFGRRSAEAREVRRAIRNEVTLDGLLRLKRLCFTRPKLESAAALAGLTHRLYQDNLYQCYRVRLIYLSTTKWAFERKKARTARREQRRALEAEKRSPSSEMPSPQSAAPSPSSGAPRTVIDRAQQNFVDSGIVRKGSARQADQPAERQMQDMSFVSYAQNFEDVILWRVFRSIGPGFFIDIGANDPVVFSVSYAFYERGWHGVDVEPVPFFAERLRQERPRDLVVEAAVSTSAAPIVWQDFEGTGLATARRDFASGYEAVGYRARRLEAPTISLASVFAKAAVEDIHWLKIGVGGLEGEVLASWGEAEARPWVVVIEATLLNSTIENSRDCERELLSHGYDFVYFDGLNRFYVHKNHSELNRHFGLGPNCFDDFVVAEFALSARLLARKIAKLEGVVEEQNTEFISARRTLAAMQAHAVSLQDQLVWARRRPLRLMRRRIQFKALKLLARVPLLPARRKARFARSAAKRNPRLFEPLPQMPNLRPAAALEGSVRSAPVIRPRSRSAKRSRTAQRTIYYYVDHTVGIPVNTGVQRVVRQLATALIEINADIVFVCWSLHDRRLVLADQGELAHLARWSGPVVASDSYPLPGEADISIPAHEPEDDAWLVIPEVTHVFEEGENRTLDVILAARMANLKVAALFYDAIPITRPEFASMASGHEAYMRGLLLTDLILPISRSSSVVIASFLRYRELSPLEGGPHIAPLPLATTFASPGEIAHRDPSSKLIVAVGTIELRKNQGALLEAFRLFSSSHADLGWRLELVGSINENMEDAVREATSSNPNIVYRGYLSDDELRHLYRSAVFTVFPSEIEGFGLPIAESLSYGKPCICADFGAMAEIAEGGGCLAVDTRDPVRLADAIAQLALEPDQLEALSEEAAKRSQTSWPDYAQSLLRELHTASSARERLGVIYYCVHATVATPFNSGIQRVARGLARAMLECGYRMTPIKWDRGAKCMIPASVEDLEHFAKWNGPAADAWSQAGAIGPFAPEDWLLCAELLLDPNDLTGEMVESWAAEQGLRTAWIFYDAIPWRSRQFYPSAFTEAHTAFMRSLQTATLVQPISDYSAGEFLSFANEAGLRMPLRGERLRAAPLPGEFLETERKREPATRGAESVRRLLCVSTVESRKNHLKLLEAFKAAKAVSSRPLELWLVGRANQEPELIASVEREVASDPAIHWEREADDARLAELYAACDFTVYPSLEEGFGLPIVESLWNARPCICHNHGAMKEVAEGGGCLMVDASHAEQLSGAILRLAQDEQLSARLAYEAVHRRFKTWKEYAEEIATSMAFERPSRRVGYSGPLLTPAEFAAQFSGLPPRPRLSICVTTYNRGGWLTVCLKAIIRLIPKPRPDIEIVVVDNASTDHTPQVVKPYLGRADFRFIRNPVNVGMLGNLRVTADSARGDFVWIVGDDDAPAPGSLEAVTQAIDRNPGAALVYLNYSYSREEDPSKIANLDAYFASATPITSPTEDRVAPIAKLVAMNENFFTAIYCLVFRRDHALRAYAQDTTGRPFSSLLTCIPTTYHVLSHMMHQKGVWLGKPQIVVNMNVSWMKYAPIWILERIPEAFDLAEKMGADPREIDKRRLDHLPSLWDWFRRIIKEDPEGNRAFFDPRHTVARFGHLAEFRREFPALLEEYRIAREANPTDFPVPAEELIVCPPGE